MKDFLLALQIAVYQQRFSIMAMVIGCVGWFFFANWILDTWSWGRVVLDTAAYCALGWFWLGQVVIPWIEVRLEDLFG